MDVAGRNDGPVMTTLDRSAPGLRQHGSADEEAHVSLAWIASSFDVRAIKLEGNEDPRKWSPARKWCTTAIISLMGFISPLGSSVVVPGGPIMGRHFLLQSRELSLLPVSFFVLGLGVGPFLLAPASELKGRQPIFLISCLLFVLFNIGTAVVSNFGALCFLRFMAGAAGSTGPSLGAGSIGDLFVPSERGRAQSLYGLGPLLGPVCGAIAGGWIAQSMRSWRWLLWFLTILSAAIAAVVVTFLRETYAPVLLRKKVQRCAREHLQAIDNVQASDAEQLQYLTQHRANVGLLAYPSGQQHRPVMSSTSPARHAKAFFRFAVRQLTPSDELRKKTGLALSRPFRLLFTNPICAIFSLYMGYIYGIIFIFLTQHPLLFQRREPTEDPPPQRLPTYGWNAGMASLTYLGLGLGFLVAALINVLLQDSIYARLVLSRGRIGWILFCDRAIISAETQRRQQEQQAIRQVQEDKGADVDHRGEFTDARPISQGGCGAASSMLTSVDEKQQQQLEACPMQSAATPGTNLEAADRLVKQQGSLNAVQALSANHTLGTASSTARPPPSAATGRPEFRLPLCLIGMIILPCGLLVFGWTAHARTHFMLPLLGSFLVGMGSILPFQAILVYLVDAFTPYSASATACAVLVRCILAAVFPLFSERLFVALGFGWGSSLLALISCFAIPVPVFLYSKGEQLRNRFRFEG